MIQNEKWKIIQDYLQSNGECNIELTDVSNDFIDFYFKCYLYIQSLMNKKVNQDTFGNDETWRNSCDEYGKEIFNGHGSIIPLSFPKILSQLIKWGLIIYSSKQNNWQDMHKDILEGAISDIPLLFQHIHFLKEKDEQCIYFQISILTSNNPQKSTNFAELIDFSWGIIDLEMCPYDKNDCT